MVAGLDVSRYLPLAQIIARKYARPGLEVEDLVQEGMICLERAQGRNYDWSEALVKTILRNRMRAMCRVHRTDDATVAVLESIPARVPTAEELLAVQGFLRALDEVCTRGQRAVLRFLLDPRDSGAVPQKTHIRELGPYTARAVAEALGIESGAAGQRLYLLRIKAAKLVREHLLARD
jgi:RNA polymerase sigma factor (sigma-70 family)